MDQFERKDQSTGASNAGTVGDIQPVEYRKAATIEEYGSTGTRQDSTKNDK